MDVAWMHKRSKTIHSIKEDKPMTSKPKSYFTEVDRDFLDRTLEEINELKKSAVTKQNTIEELHRRYGLENSALHAENDSLNEALKEALKDFDNKSEQLDHLRKVIEMILGVSDCNSISGKAKLEKIQDVIFLELEERHGYLYDLKPADVNLQIVIK